MVQASNLSLPLQRLINIDEATDSKVAVIDKDIFLSAGPIKFDVVLLCGRLRGLYNTYLQCIVLYNTYLPYPTRYVA